MSRFSQLRTRYSSSADSTLSAQSLASLNQKASHPPERLHRLAGSAEEPAILYIFRIPGRRELCLSNLRPQGDVVTDIDVSAALYILRFDAAQTSASITLLRSSEGQMEEVAYIEDPPGHIDVFEEQYSHIERRYWDVHVLEPKAAKASFSCQLNTTESGLSFQTPWVGTASIVPVKLGNALKCYHTIRHAEGDEAREKMQVSELRFNFQMPKGVVPEPLKASKRASIAGYLRDSSTSGRNLTRSLVTANGPNRTSSSNEITQLAGRRSRPVPGSFIASPPTQGLRGGHQISCSGAPEQIDSIGSPADLRDATSRVKGPRPMRARTVGNLDLEQGATQGHVNTGKPVEASSAVSRQPHVAEKGESASDPLENLQTPQPLSARPTYNTANMIPGQAMLAHRTPSIKRKPVGMVSSQSQPPLAQVKVQEPVPQSSQNENQPPTAISKRPTDPVTSASGSPIKRVPVPMFNTFDAIEAKDAAYSRPDSDQEPPPLPERPSDPGPMNPALPSRRASINAFENPYPRNITLLDLSLGQEKLGGGFDGEQAKLGKLIVQPEGQKMLDLIVAANMLAFHRAFVAADVMGR